MRKKLLLPAIAVCVLAPVAAQATVVLPVDFKQLTSRATVIVRGRVVSLNSQWGAQGRGIETMVTVEISHSLKGDVAGEVTFRVPGGKIGRFRAVTVGAPVFHEGDEVIVFVEGNSPEIPRIVGFNQGVYRVSVDRTSGARVVMPPLLSANAATPTTIVRGDPSRKPIPVEQFEARVRAMLDRAPDRASRPRPRDNEKRPR